MSLMKWEPFKEMEPFFDLLETWPRARSWDLAVDVYEDGNNLVAELNAPGVDPAKVDISINDGYLMISGSRERSEEKKGKNYYSKEIQHGSFSRSVWLPYAVDDSATSASYRDGVLKVTMPRVKGSIGPKKIPVKIDK